MTKKFSILLTVMFLILMLVPTNTVFAGNLKDPTKDPNTTPSKVTNTVDSADLEDFGVSYSSDGKLIYGGAYRKDSDQSDVWNKIFVEYKGIIMGITGIGTMTMVVFFILNFIKLAKSADNPSEKSRALNGLLWTGIAAAGLGGVTIFVGVAQNLLKTK